MTAERDALLVWNVIAFLATEHIEGGLSPEDFAGATVDNPESLFGLTEWLVELTDEGKTYARCVVREGVVPSVLRIMDGGKSLRIMDGGKSQPPEPT